MADALRRKDAFELECLIKVAIVDRGVAAAWNSILSPLMAWASSAAGRAGSDIGERILAHCIASALAVVMVESPVPNRHERVVVTAAPGEPVDLGVRALGTALACEAVDVALMPSRISVRALAAGIDALQPDIVVLWLPDVGASVVPLVRALRRRRTGLRIFVAGGGSADRTLPRSIDTLDDIDSAIDAVVGAVT